MKLMNYRKEFSGKNAHYFGIRLLNAAGKTDNCNTIVLHCSIEKMIVDYVLKLLVWHELKMLCNSMLNLRIACCFQAE